MRLALLLVAALLSAAFVPAGGALSPDGYGALKIGMTVNEVRAISTRPLTSAQSDEPEHCEMYMFGQDTGLYFMAQRHQVTRVSLYGKGYATAEGVQVGDPVAKVHTAYGKGLQRDVAPYGEEPAHDLHFWRTPDRGLRFEINYDGKVAAIHGGSDAIRYIEGCL